MVLSFITKRHIEEKLEKRIRYPSDFEQLVISIQKETKRRVSLNTLKRLFGVIKCVNTPRMYTLDTLAEYLGYESWELYSLTLSKLETKNKPSLASLNRIVELHSDSLAHGQKVAFQYYPDHTVEMEYIGEKCYRVEHSSNGVLKVNDIVEVRGFHLGYPLLIPKILRQGVNLGRYMAGEVSGLTHLEVK